ncbi:MAG: 50S ribosomal protein L11 [Desulfurellaceae bacterium]|jgi:large subunit ribosomal protein L11|nr:50S ribosomal protein L11 [Desulfurellaceae bacterium]
MKEEAAATIKLQIQAGKASPAPPVGPALGQHGINIMDFCKKFNEQTKDKGDYTIPVVIKLYKNRSFSFVTKTPPASELIMKALKIEKGSSVPNKTKVGELSKKDLRNIAQMKLPDLNTKDIEKAMKIVAGTAQNMGVEVEL